MISENFKEILDNFEKISETEEFKGHPFATKIKKDFAGEIKEIINDIGCDEELYYVKGFPGMTTWAKYPNTYPEFRILNYNAASNFKKGLYLLYRFDLKNNCVYLIMGQGWTNMEDNVLIDIANELVSKIDSPLPEGFKSKFTGYDDGKYSEAVIISKCYFYEDLNDNVLKSDFESIIKVYEQLIPEYLKTVCNKGLNTLISEIHKSGKNKLMINDNCESESATSIDSQDTKIWWVGADRDSVKIDAFKKNNFVGIGWFLDDLSGMNKKDIEDKYVEVYGETKSKGQDVSQINNFVNEINIGDYIISSDKLKRNFILGICNSDYYLSNKKDNSSNGEEFWDCRDVKWLCSIKWDSISEDNIKYLRSPKSVSEIKNDIAKKELLDSIKVIQPFSNDEPGNIIYFGAPGTGKSHNLNEDVSKLLKDTPDNYERVTFHPDYTYANFVGTYKPVSKEDSKYPISYEYVPGPFMRTLVKALKTPSEPFILVIEEINRANVAAVFGDVFQLLDRDDITNISQFPINASEDMKNYLKKELNNTDMFDQNKCGLRNYWKSILGQNYDKIKIPSNMLIWATMNSADQGVFPMDTAFKRRWDFIYFDINQNEKEIENLKVKICGKEIQWNKLRRAINDELVLTYRINEDKLIGPFFAFKEFKDKIDLTEDEEKKFKKIFKNKIIMYLFEDAARSRRNELFSGVKETSNLTYSQICKSFDEKGVGIFCKNIQDKFI